MKVFVSYSHAQGDWVFDKLEPCLKAGGAEVLIDRREFVAGPGLIGQMDETQDRADRHVLVISNHYLQSDKCVHELKRAIALDPTFKQQLVIVVRRDDTSLPDEIARHEPLYVDLRDDQAPTQWEYLLTACGASLGTTAPTWLKARDDIERLLEHNRSVNLVVRGDVRWEPLIDELIARPALRLVNIDLLDPATVSRRGLIATILEALGSHAAVPNPPEDLPQFRRILDALPHSRVALRHFDLVLNRPEYGVDLFATLRFVAMERRQLVLLAQSRTPFSALLPQDNPISKLYVETIELGAHRQTKSRAGRN